MLDLLVDLLGCFPRVGLLAGKAFVDDDSKGIQVGIEAHLHTLELLRRHIVRAADKALLVLEATL